MTTRRNLFKAATVGALGTVVPALPAQAASLHPVAYEQLRNFGTLLDGAAFHVETGQNRRRLARHLWFDQDIDGSWCIGVDCVGPGDHDDRPPEGAITIWDPTIAAFLEQLHRMVSDPIGFGRQTFGREPII